MWEASRALKRVQKEHVQPRATSETSLSDSGRPSRTRGSAWGGNSQDSPEQPEVFDDRGRLPEDDDDEVERRSTAAWSSQSWKNYGWDNWHQGGWQEDEWSSWRSAEYQPPANWETDVQDFLPDFLTGFLLLNRSGLDAHERAKILAAIRGEFSVKTVEKALREQGRDDDLAKRDRAKQYANYVHEDDEDHDEEGLAADLEAPNPADDPQGYEAFMGEQQEIDLALEAIKEKKRTLKEARWRQHQVKMNRKFYPSSPYRPAMRSTPSSTTSSSTTVEKCLSCGGRHKTSSCPTAQKAHVVEEAAEVAFGAVQEEYAAPAAVDKSATVTQHMQQGNHRLRSHLNFGIR
eukprot:s23_g18.t1